MNILQKRVIDQVERRRGEMAAIARYIGRHPELAFHEFCAQRKLVSFLRKNGFHVVEGVGSLKTAFVATRRHGRGPNIGFLAEYDALPEIGHACGHNLIGVASCAAAIAAAKGMADFSGTLTVVGCPAEEGGGGKILLAKQGVFKPLSCAMMVHPDSKTEVLKESLALIEMNINFIGRTSHAAAAPEKGINALDSAVGTYQRIKAYCKRLPKDARVHGIFLSAGQKPNLIPDFASLQYWVRSFEMRAARRMVLKIQALAMAEAKKTGAGAKFRVNPLAYEPFHPNRALANLFKKQLKVLGIRNQQGNPKKGVGSSDVGNVGRLVPMIHPTIRICQKGTCHTPQFARAALSKAGFEGMAAAAKLLALTATELFLNPAHLIGIGKEFKRRKK